MNRDGKGNVVWPTWGDETSGPETFFDVQLPDSPDEGCLYLECTVDDSDDFHGIITEARIGRGDRPTLNQRSGAIVNIELAAYSITTPGKFTLDPVRGFVFVLRRFGPPGSITWDVEPL